VTELSELIFLVDFQCFFEVRVQKNVFLARVFCDMDIQGFCMCLILKKCLNQWHDVGNDRFDLPAVVRGEVFGFKAQPSGVSFTWLLRHQFRQVMPTRT
jgi:hypothetical protein